MERPRFGRARRLRDSNTVLVAVLALTVAVFAPFVSLVSDTPFKPSPSVLVLSWWAGVAVLSAYGVVHVLAAFVDTRRFLDRYGTEHASAPAVYCHALGQRLLVLLWTGFALVGLAVAGPGVDAPLAVLVALGLFAAFLLGPPTAIPMNRRVSERLADYRDE